MTMTRRQAIKWANGTVADILIAGMAMGEIIPPDDPDYDKKNDAMMNLMSRLRKLGDNPPPRLPKKNRANKE